jgi:very-short-patch-repair endonuclease
VAWERAGERVSAPRGAKRVLTNMPYSSRLSSLRMPGTGRNAKNLRSRMTIAETRLWYHLRAGRFQGWKFRRQVPLGTYVVDFLCEEARLIVEADGGQHADDAAADEERTNWLNSRGYEVMRFWNNDVLGNTQGVLTILAERLAAKLPSPLSLSKEDEEQI